jgi:hypothetical protein
MRAVQRRWIVLHPKRTSRGLHPKAARHRNRTRDRRQVASRMGAVVAASRTGGMRKGTNQTGTNPILEQGKQIELKRA